MTREDLIQNASAREKYAKESSRKRRYAQAMEMAREIVRIGSNAQKVGCDTHLTIAGIVLEALDKIDAEHAENITRERALERETFTWQAKAALEALAKAPISR